MSGHTKLPWRIFKTRDGRKIIGVGTEDGEGILDAGFGIWAWNDAEGIANAEFAVNAVNNHDALVKALKMFVAWGVGNFEGTLAEQHHAAMEAGIEALRAASSPPTHRDEPSPAQTGVVP